MRRFNLVDKREGQKVVALGVMFPNEQTVVQWLGATPSLVIWPTFTTFLSVSVSGHDHEGKLAREVTWWDGDEDDKLIESVLA
jgi:hypothetical protein